MKLVKPFLIRLLIVTVPLLGLYIFAQMAFKANRSSEHPTDPGLGIAFLLIFMLIVLFIGFIVDFIRRLINKQYQLVAVDSFFLLLFVIPIAYIGCLIGSRDCFCKWIIDTVDFLR